MKVNATTATWAHVTYKEALERLKTTVDPFIGEISLDHVQLCPQNAGFNDLNSILQLVDLYPETKFRLHADVKVVGRNSKADLVYFNKDNIKNWECIANISNTIKAKCYSLHAGFRESTFDELIDKYHQLQELFDCPVAIEGHYPAGSNRYHLADWDDHEQLFLSGAKYVVDLSHFNIIATRFGWNDDLINAMITHENCLEIHVSANTGRVDAHEPIESEPVWWKYLSNTTADVFYEGNHSIIELRNTNPDFFKRKK